MREQLNSMGTMFDWRREAVIFADPEYYRWTQWFFHRNFLSTTWLIAKCHRWIGARTAIPRWPENRFGVMTAIVNAAELR